jgi:nicotinamidase-related amidase
VSPSPRRVQALIVVDLQSAFVSGPDAVPAAARLLPVVEAMMSAARDRGALVVQLQNDGPPGTPDEPGTPGWQLFLPAGPGEHVIRKTVDDGFYRTPLSGLLTRHGIRHLAVCGVMSEMCVSATARSALALGYHVVLPHDAHATYDIPAVDGLADLVPHAIASRTAEWALGDEIDIIARAADLSFAPLSAG